MTLPIFGTRVPSSLPPLPSTFGIQVPPSLSPSLSLLGTQVPPSLSTSPSTFGTGVLPSLCPHPCPHHCPCLRPELCHPGPLCCPHLGTIWDQGFPPSLFPSLFPFETWVVPSSLLSPFGMRVPHPGPHPCLCHHPHLESKFHHPCPHHCPHLGLGILHPCVPITVPIWDYGSPIPVPITVPIWDLGSAILFPIAVPIWDWVRWGWGSSMLVPTVVPMARDHGMDGMEGLGCSSAAQSDGYGERGKEENGNRTPLKASGD